MRTNQHNLPASVRKHFTKRGYHHFQEEHPDFGGIIIYFQTARNREEAAYYISKPSTIELVTSEELRLALDFLEETGVPLRHAVTTSRFSDGSHILARENRIDLWELDYQVEIAEHLHDVRVKRQPFRPGESFASSAFVNPNEL